MAILEWSDDLRVGFGPMDEEHKKLIDLINDLDAAISAGHAADVIGGFLEDLISYTVWHFRNEEGLMQQYGYPQALSHRVQHVDLTETAEDLQQRFLDGDHELADTLTPFLKTWLTDHIMGTDKALGRFLADKVEAATA
ncbi:bacteriohemerythrin [Roseospira marina]|nr:bacteriohemerythrin [Roseospira marina]MBB4316209.1 hemerythrin-like metal-binding protein [Roseospira marina]MBB5087809.1 hemerythrin-like metal-binding protein [Roseospira marina]